MVHKSLVCRDSSFFKAACKGGFREAESNEVKLPDDEPEIFDNFVRWLYTQDIERPSTASGPDWEHLVNIYVLADKLGAPKFGNCVMQIIAQEVWLKWDEEEEVEPSLPDAAAVCVAYENTPASSPLRQFLEDVYCCNNKVQIPMDAVPDEFVMDIVITLKRISVESGAHQKFWESYDLCHYSLAVEE